MNVILDGLPCDEVSQRLGLELLNIKHLGKDWLNPLKTVLTSGLKNILLGSFCFGAMVFGAMVFGAMVLSDGPVRLSG